MPAGVARFLLDKVNAASGLGLGEDEIDEAIKAPLARACFTASRAFFRSPDSASWRAVPGSGTASTTVGASRNGLMFGQMKYGSARPTASCRSL